MKRVLLAALLVFIPSVSWSEEPVRNEWTQSGMNESAEVDLKKAESKMADLLRRLHLKAKGYPEAIKKLEAAQKAWANYRDLQIQALWPNTEHMHYGSVHPMCVMNMKATLTEARNKELESMLSTPEGDACLPFWPQ